MRIFLLLAIVGFCGASLWAAERDLWSDTWVATDALGRRLPVSGKVRGPRSDKIVGLFYFVWHGGHGTPGPFDITNILQANPADPNYGPNQAFHWWGEPEAGYFLATDAWVIRRNLSMLQDAGADVLIIDVTNAFTYSKEIRALCEVARQMRKKGNKTPQICFITHSHAAATQQRLWDEFYSKNLFPELWFRWQGKPLLLGERDAKFDDGRPLPEAIKQFFTWRYSWAWDAGPGKWQWIDTFPQDPGLNEDGKVVEQMPVAVASHPTSHIGRSYHDKQQPPIDQYAMTPTYGQGLHFAEQWQRALQIDPPFVFVTGWNEWVAQRFIVDGASGPSFLGKPTKKGDTFFVDAYNAEFNRDIEPMRGGSSDNLYYQLVANVRRFKGARRLPPASPPRKMVMDGRFAEWRAAGPEYRDTVGDTAHRDHKGWGDLRYTDATGRNDIIASKVACDAANIYFYVETRNTLTPHTGPSWMLLFIDADQNAATGWNGYEYVINNSVTSENSTTLKRFQSGQWTTTGKLDYRAQGREMEIRVPRALIGKARRARVTLDFHWADNISLGGGITEFFLHGDSAPNRRFNYRYENRSF